MIICMGRAGSLVDHLDEVLGSNSRLMEQPCWYLRGEPGVAPIEAHFSTKPWIETFTVSC